MRDKSIFMLIIIIKIHRYTENQKESLGGRNKGPRVVRSGWSHLALRTWRRGWEHSVGGGKKGTCLRLGRDMPTIGARQHSNQTHGSRRVVPEPVAAASPEKCDECQFLGPIPEILVKKSRGWGPISFITQGFRYRESLRTGLNYTSEENPVVITYSFISLFNRYLLSACCMPNWL